MTTITGSFNKNMITFTEAAANGALLWTAVFGLMFIYLLISDTL